MGVREIDWSLEQWQMGVKDLRRRVILAPTPRERERWYAILLLAQGLTAAATAEALERDPHTIASTSGAPCNSCPAPSGPATLAREWKCWNAPTAGSRCAMMVRSSPPARAATARCAARRLRRSGPHSRNRPHREAIGQPSPQPAPTATPGQLGARSHRRGHDCRE